MSRVRARCLAVLIPIFILLGCGMRSQSPPEAPPPNSPPPVPQQSGAVIVSPEYAALSPGQTRQFKASSNAQGSVAWYVNHILGGNASIGLIDANGNYTAPVVSLGTRVTVTAALAASPDANYASASVAIIASGQITPTANPQVVIYSIYLPGPGDAAIEFGSNTQNNLSTSVQPTPSPNGGMIHIYVAGMRAQTVYHMHAIVNLNSGLSFQDSDHVFTTGIPPAAVPIQVFTSLGQQPQSGIEMFDTVNPPTAAQAFATDLQGNVLWTYTYQGSSLDAVQAIKLLPNGNLLLLISFASSVPANVASRPPGGTIDVVREVDLAGNTIRQLTLDDLARSLTILGYNFHLKGFHHDLLPLPNGHIVLLVNLTQPVNNVAGFPGTSDVLGDLLVDVNEDFTPTWVWNTFDHLDVNRHPFGFPDWTHGNALLYSADDHNLLFSMRQQNWIVKIDYQDGHGSGNILWRLGPGGDFKLIGGIDPTDWFYAQHGPSYFTPNTTGIFQLGLMDNGNDRQFPPGVTCGAPGSPPCQYSTAPVFEIDETAMTATLLSRYTPSPIIYSYFGGNLDLLPNGDAEVDFCAPPAGAVIQELQDVNGTPVIVWQATTPGFDQFRAVRLPSLYPGVQW